MKEEVKKPIAEQLVLAIDWETGRRKFVMVDASTARLYEYSNGNGTVTYNAEVVENGERTGFWTEFDVPGTVDDLEEKLQTWNNPVKLAYAMAMDFNAGKNDPDGTVWRHMVEYVRGYQHLFFKKNGDWRKRMILDPKRMVLKIKAAETWRRRTYEVEQA